MVHKILDQMGYPKPLAVSQFRSEEDGEGYNVWRLDYPERSYVLKQANANESANYRCYFREPCSFAPQLFASAVVDDNEYLLMAHISGVNLMRCTRENLRSALDSLIDMENRFWQAEDSLCSFEKALEGRVNRGEYLNDPRLDSAYNVFLKVFSELPRTLCHDDLLPFNVIVNDRNAVFIDWEVAGILPYPTSLARLIAHTTEENDAFFFMKETDKRFAIDYYFENFIKGRGVPYGSYRRHLDLCLLYEYCEWVYLGNRYPDADQLRFQSYRQKALNLAEQILK